ncbi:uncharacterized protein PHACADRAFT_262436 [Phanerochaete carnosa HHB-10118-sp]|uniref:Uncharacterized protein n=1 Tax=Phanerochaete carnosa (strain HHB-10118-sp) TaxID=650164 RepID=K5VKR7_PHACS|nr:uncharacterized protein PHACADRAFT_262436 [Phanerochaete carnosa HHB-10118-sp]EKM51988.1 hypothetical protein PHACADRAFT_262436 [Phanerochaete carnosa HHB-10118-sp]
MGFTIRGDDPKELEQVKSMISLKQQQQALIEQRRGSTAGIAPPTAAPEVNVVNALTPDERSSSSAKTGPSRVGRRSPNTAAPAISGGPRRSIVAGSSGAPVQTMSSSSRQPTPPPPSSAATGTAHRSQVQNHPPPRPATDSPPTQTHLHPSQASTSSNPAGASHALPAPPISFARRRASRQLMAGTKGKPADIVINPRATTESHFQPAIQSAPPVSRSGSDAGMARLSSMALPSLPPVLQPGQAAKRYSNGQVPPTPTRLGVPRHSVAGAGGTGISGRSPPTASIPISSNLVPPTPASLHHPGYTGEKSAFLAPFEMFYDALSDSKHLKAWLSEQLQKSSALIANLQRQQAHIEDTVNSIVEKKMSTMREEVYGLRVRVDELETVLRMSKVQGYSPNMATKHKGKPNGYQVASPTVAPIAPESYTFPPVESSIRRPEPVRRVSSPGSEGQSFPNSQAASPVPFDANRRLSVSATRLDPHPLPPVTRASVSYLPSRELPPHNFPPPPLQQQHQHQQHAAGPKGSWSPLSTKTTLPTSSTRSSLSHTTLGAPGSLALPERPSLTRRSSGERQGRMHPPEKRRASRSPGADEEGRAERGPPSHLLGQRRGSVPSVLLSGERGRPRSPMDES